MRHSARGTALPETAIVLAVVLLVIFGITQLSLLGFYQAAAEGAAFVGAHSLSLTSTGNQSTDTAYANSIVPTPFPIVKTPDLAVTYPSPSSILQVTVTKNAPGLLMVPGAASTVGLQGADLEPILGNATLSTPPPFSIADQAVLKNYCGATTAKCNSSYTMYIAQCYQGTDPNSCGKGNSGNGVNGAFGEWQCRQDMFAAMASAVESVNWPSGAAAPGPSSGGLWDPTNRNFNQAEAAVYNYDSQTSKWGSSPSC